MKYNLVKLGDYLYIKGRIGWKGLKKDEYLPHSDYQIINGESLTNDGIDWGRAGFISRERYEESPEIMLEDGDILISKDGTIGKIGYVEGLNGKATVASGIFVIRNQKPTQIETRYIYHFLCSPAFKNFITMRTEGSVIPHLYQKDFVELEVPLPDLITQKRIVGILDAISCKIEVNKAINNNLQQQAEALFAENFLNITDIPLGWRKGNLLDIADYLNGLAMQKFRPKEGELGLPVLKIKELRQGFCDTDSELCSPSIRSDYLVHDGDVVFSWSGSLLVDFWCGGDCGLNQHLFKVTSRRYEPWFYYLWTNYHLAKFVAIAADKATTMGHIKREDLAKAKVLIPSTEDYNKIGEVLRPLLSMAIYNRIENKKLSTLRDAILPKLMSGEIDVSEVEI